MGSGVGVALGVGAGAGAGVLLGGPLTGPPLGSNGPESPGVPLGGSVGAGCFVVGAGLLSTGRAVIPTPGCGLARKYPSAAVMLGNALVPT